MSRLSLKPRLRRLATGVAVAALTLGVAATALADPQRYAVIATGEKVGWLVVDQTGTSVAIDYHVDNNGRGPKHRERLELDATGLPLSWRIQGTSLFGGQVDETFERSPEGVRWRSQADAGVLPASGPGLYVANDDSPWSLALYARALKAAPGRSMDVAPAGRLRLEEVRRLDFGGAPATAYRLTGLTIEPGYVLLDDRDDMVAEFSGDTVTVREGLEGEERALHRLLADHETERVRNLQTELAHRFDAPVRIRNVRIFDPREGRLSDLSSVTVFRNHVSGVVPEDDRPARPDEYVIDGEGGVLVPGLHDMHSHSSMQTGLYYLGAGVTATRDMGNNNPFLLDLMKQIEGGVLPGPRITPNGMLEGRSPYAVRTGIVADSLEEALDGVRWYADRNYWQVKIYNSLHPEWVAPVAAEAHRLGMKVTGHVPAFVSPDQAIEAGYDDIAHINQLMLGWLLQPGEDSRTPLRLTAMPRAAGLDLDSAPVRRTIDLMKARGTALDVTAVTLEVLMMSRAGEIPPSAAAYVEHMPIGYQRYRRRSFVDIDTPEKDAGYRAGFRKLLDTVKRLHDEGIVLLPGTDAGEGFTVHRELELYVEAGLTPAQALTLGTLTPERYLGRDQTLGTIERGKLADFFLIPGDPTADISAIRQIRLVMKDGVAYLPSEVHEALGVRPFVAPAVIQRPSVPTEAIGEAGPGFLFAAPGHDHLAH